MDSKRRKTGDQDVSALRLASRQKYLAEREAQQLALLRRQVAEEAEEEERLGNRLSAKEKKEFETNRKTLELAEARNAIDDNIDGRFFIPDADYSNKHEALTKRHKDKGYEKSEVQLWEEEQMRKIKSQPKAERVVQEDYEYVFDESANVFDASKIDLGSLDMAKQRLQSTLDEAEAAAKSIQEVRQSLPVYKYKDEFINAVANHQILVLVGSTGSGKTTQLTQYLLDAGYAKTGRIACTQPRRVAAMSVAKRVATEYGCKVGREVGYSVRFENAMSDVTKIEYMTDGLLLRQCLGSVLLEDYSAVIIDEAHERTLSTEVLMALLKDVCAVRPEFRLIIASATMNATEFSDYFGNCPVLNVPGKLFPITKHHVSAPEANYVAASVSTVFQLHLAAPPGDILVFLTGEDEILLAQEQIESTMRKLGNRAPPLIVAPVYGALPSESQQLIFAEPPKGTRKVVLATNIAETSLTIDGITMVIDCGLQKSLEYNPRSFMSSLVVEPCSQASCEQRAGRAGRTQAGMAFRLFTRHAFYNELPTSTPPEILRANLDSVYLLLKSMVRDAPVQTENETYTDFVHPQGINDVLSFDFMAKPPVESIAASLENLYALGYIQQEGIVTKMGRRATELPLDPRLAKVLLAADELGCVDEAITLVAMIQEAGTLFFSPKDKKAAADIARQHFSSTEGGDLITLLKVWDEFVENEYSMLWCKENFIQYRSLNRIRDVRDQLHKLCDRVEIAPSSCGIQDHVKILKSFCAGFFANAAVLNKDGMSYRSLRGGLSIHIHPSSCLSKTRPKLIIYAELVLTSKEWARNVAPIEPDWLVEAAPHYHKKSDIDDLGVGKKLSKGQGKVGTGR
jgi:pre-mRNA-splicing factor ATP-dependent RNA helicase DHX16